MRLLLIAGDQFPAQPLEAAADAGVDAQRARLQDDASDQRRDRLPRGVDAAAGRALDLPDDVGAPRRRRARRRSSSSTSMRPSSRATSRSNSRSTSSSSAARPRCVSTRRKLRTSSSASRRGAPRAPRPWRADRPGGCVAAPAAPAPRGPCATKSASCSRTIGRRPCSFAASSRARAYMRCATPRLH